MSRRPGLLSFGLLLAALLGVTAQAGQAAERSFDSPTCLTIIGVAERESGIPATLLRAIALAETGRIDPLTGRVTPWAWSINANGTGEMFATKLEAIAAMRAKLELGVTSVDVGCMQVNLAYHPDAFASADEAFQPEANVRYAARFLRALYRQTGDWATAAMAYHSQTPDIGADYLRRVVALWPSASTFGAAGGRAGLAGRSPAAVAASRNYTPEFALWLRQNGKDTAQLMALHGATSAESAFAPARRGGRLFRGDASALPHRPFRADARPRQVARASD